MATRREAIGGLVGAAVLAGGGGVSALAADQFPDAGGAVTPALLGMPGGAHDIAYFPKGGPSAASLEAAGYVAEEWFASGVDDNGLPYRTQVILCRPADRARFSGSVIVEALYVHGIAPLYMYSSAYMVRSGHAWACVASQRTSLEAHVKPASPTRYASLHIETSTSPAHATLDLLSPPVNEADDTARAAWWKELERFNRASSAILGQVGAAIRGAMQRYAGRDCHLLLGGVGITGFTTSQYVRHAHEARRLLDGKPVFDGFFVASWGDAPFGPRDVPLIQVMCDGDVPDGSRGNLPGFANRAYRRADSDKASDRYRLYEFAGVAHMGTRSPPHNTVEFWKSVPQAGPIPANASMNSLPHQQLYNMAIDQLVNWVSKNRVPPRAERIALAAGGRYFAKDENGNSIGGVRCVQLDVPRATYYSMAPNADGTPTWGTVGTEVAFPPARLKQLYANRTGYLRNYERRLAQLVAKGWMLPDDAPDMQREAEALIWTA